jgi:predicted dehydrogenase
MTKPRLGFIGYGNHARTNLFPSLRASGISLTAISTRHSESAEAAARVEGAELSFGSHNDMLRSTELDGVFVSVDADDQAHVVSDCLRAGVHVFAEKPVGMTEHEADQVAELASERNLILSVGFMKRYAPAYRRLESLMQSDLGRVMSFNIFFGFNPWTTDLRDDSFLRLAGVHVTNLVHGLFGEIASVSGETASQDSDISLAFALKSAAGVAGSLTFVGSPAWNSEREHVQVSGTGGRATVDDVSRLEFRPRQPTSSTGWREQTELLQTFAPQNTPASGAEQHLFTRGFVGELVAFVEAVETGSPLPTTGVDNSATMRLSDRLIAAIN